jgi:Uma2 family endonuclease
MSATIETVADLLTRLGGVPPERIRFHPIPGTATEADVLDRPHGEKRLYELIDGVLVEKPTGYYESRLALLLGHFLEAFLATHDLGIVLGADAALRLMPGRIRIPDLAFVGWNHFPGRLLPSERIPDLVPDLAVEVMSESNTESEMAHKLREYFAAGVQLVWYVYPENRTVSVYTSPTAVQVITESETLDGGSVLPGFQLPIQEWFQRAGARREV